MPNDHNAQIDTLVDVMQLRDRPSAQIRQLAEEVSRQKVCIMDDACLHKTEGLFVTLADGKLVVGCQEDATLVSGWSQGHPIVPAKLFWSKLDRMATLRQEEENKRSVHERYRIYLINVRGMKAAHVTDTLIDTELAQKQAVKIGRS